MKDRPLLVPGPGLPSFVQWSVASGRFLLLVLRLENKDMNCDVVVDVRVVKSKLSSDD